MAIVNPVSYLHNRTDHTGRTDRLAISSLLMPDGAGLTWREGVRGALDCKVTQRGAGANMSVDIAAGSAFIKQDSSGQGCYNIVNDGTVNQAITAADPTNPRKDLICLKVEDAFFSGAANQGSIAYVQGVAASSPVDPAAPANSIILARVNVAAAASSIVDANINDLRPMIAGVGGIHTVIDNTERNALAATSGRVVWNLATQRLEVYDGSAWRVLAPDAKVLQSGTVAVTVSAAATGAAAVTFPTAFSVAPLVTVSATGTSLYNVAQQSVTTTGFTVLVRHIDSTSSSTTVNVHWYAHGTM